MYEGIKGNINLFFECDDGNGDDMNITSRMYFKCKKIDKGLYDTIIL